MAWNQPEINKTASKAKSAKKPTMVRGIVAGAIVAIGAAAVFWMLSTPENPKKPDVTKTPVKVPVKVVEPVKPTTPDVQPEEPVKEAVSPKRRIRDIVRMRHGRKNLTEADKAEIAALEAFIATNTDYSAGMSSRKSVFSSHSDQVIAMVLTAGDNIPPFPGSEKDLEKEFIRSLNTPIVINDDDSDRVKKMKQMVIAAREEIDAQMKEGRGFREILEEHRQQVAENAELRREVREMARQMMAEGNGDMVDNFLEQANKQLSESGVDPVERPLTKEERLEFFRQRRLERQNQQKEQK